MGVEVGIFVAVDHLRRAGELSPEEEARYFDIDDWFIDSLMSILIAHGVEHDMVTASDPGHQIYEDEYQIGVVPRIRHEQSVMPEGVEFGETTAGSKRRFAGPDDTHQSYRDLMTDPARIEIRHARPDELERVVRLRWLWTTLDRGEEPQMEQAAFITGAADWARAHADTHIAHVAVSEDGAIVGMAWLALTPRVATTRSFDRWSGDLQSCYVLPEFRSSGIGGRLVQAVLDTATRRGAEHVTVHTSQDSPDMYARNGFRANPRLLFADSALVEDGTHAASTGLA